MTNKEALKILGNISVDYTGLTLREAKLMDEALTLSIKTLESIDHIEAEKGRIESFTTAIDDDTLSFQETIYKLMIALEESNRRITELEKELEESRAKEGKGALEIAIDSVAELITSLNEAIKGMSPEEIRAIMQASEEEEEDEEEDRDTESE